MREKLAGVPDPTFAQLMHSNFCVALPPLVILIPNYCSY